MWKVIKLSLATSWGFLFASALFIFTTWLAGRPIPNLPHLLSLLSANRFWVAPVLILLGVLALVAFQQDSLKNPQKKVLFYTSTSRLKPSDMNPSKPWYDRYFIPRPAVNKVVELLAAGRGAVLLGVPLAGKTRCAFEVLKRLRGYHVLTLIPEKQTIAEIRIPRSYLIFKPKLILFLDDLQAYVDKFSPVHLVQHFGKQSKSLAVLATCRSGDEFRDARKEQAFSSFINQNLPMVDVEELSKDEEKKLAAHFGREWTETSYKGTPGSIVFGLEEMKQRLRAASREAKALMRSLCLMREAGIRTHWQVLTQKVAEKVYEVEITRPSADSAWGWLRNAGFLAIRRDMVVPTHAVYIGSSFSTEYETGDAAKDIKTLWQVVSVDGNAREVYDIALNYGLHGDDQMAEMGFRKYVELVPADSLGHGNLGAALGRQGRAEEEETELREAIRLDPNYAEAHYNLGLALRKQGRAEEEETELREAIRLNPNGALAHCDLGVALGRQGRGEEAETEFRQAIRLDPNHADAHYNLGVALYNQGRGGEAEREFREAIRLDPNHASAHYNLGVVLGKQGRAEEAERELCEAIRLDPNDAEAHYNLGVALYNQGRGGEAEREFREAIRLDPNHASAHYNLGVVLGKQGRAEEAERELCEAIRLDPNDAEAHYNLGVALDNHGRGEEAEREYREAIRLDPNHAQAHYALGVMRWLDFAPE